MGAELIQIQEGEERAVAYGSLTLTSEQQKYCTTRKELLAIIRFSRQFRHYLLGRHFTVRTDHNSLTWLMNFKEPQGQLARWKSSIGLGRSIRMQKPCQGSLGGTMFRLQSKSEITGFAMWGVSLLY